jgi:hypothetical protein
MTVSATHDAPKFLKNGAVVLFYTEQHSGGNGFRRHGICLAYWTDREEFVTWRVYVDDDNQWCAETGNYFQDVIPAAKDYISRGGDTLSKMELSMN